MVNYRKNAFGPIRYYAAFCVMYLHFTGYMRTLVPYEFGNITILRSIVDFYQPTIIMFAISGFLISASIERSGLDAKSFIYKRILKIYPDLWISMIVYLIVLIVIISSYFDMSVVKWVLVQGIGFAYTPSCLKSFATGSINGPLWFVTVLLQLYVAIFLFKLVTKNSTSLILHTVVCGLLMVCNYVSLILCKTMGETASKLLERCFLPYAIWFFVGVFFQTCGLYKKNSVKKIAFILVPLHAFIRISGWGDVGYYTGIITGIITAILTIIIAFSLPKVDCKVDLTYGMYLYHWLFLNIIIHYKIYENLSWISCLLIFTGMTLVFAYVFRWGMLKRLLINTGKER